MGGAPAGGGSAPPAQLLFGIAQGAADPELRRRSIEEISALAFDGHALGGLAVGESRDEMFEATAWAAPLLPAERARYFMGIGDAEGILRVIGAGIDSVRLRPADADGAHRLRADGGRAPQPAQRPLRP